MKPQFVPLKLHGLVFDQKPEDVPADRWSNGRNVFFKNQDMYRCEGIGQIFGTALFDVEICWYVDTGAQEWWYYASDAGVGVTDGRLTHYNITPVGWGPIAKKNFIWTAGDLNCVPWINHPEKGPFWHDANPAHVMTKLPDWPATWAARVMLAHKNFLFALNIDTGAGGLLESQASWSSSANPGQIPSFWNPSPTNDAGDWSFATPGGPLIGGISIRDQLFISKINATAALQYTGGQWVFQARDVFPSTGLYAPKAAVEYGNMVYMLTGAGEFVRHDGNQIQNLLYGTAQDFLIAAINPQWTDYVFCYMTDQKGVVALAYPTTGSRACTEAIGIEVASIGEGGVDLGLRDLPGVYGAAVGFTAIDPESWDGAVGTWDTDALKWGEQPTGYRPAKVVFAGGANQFLELGRTDSVLGVPVAAFAERTALDVGDFGTHKVLSGAFPRFYGQTGDVLKVRFGSQEQTTSLVEWGTEINATIGATQQLDFFEEGRLIAISVRSDTAAAWVVHGMQVLARKAGRW